jgi:hypothetical protein
MQVLFSSRLNQAFIVTNGKSDQPNCTYASVKNIPMIKDGVLSAKAGLMTQQIKYYFIFGLTKSGLSSGSWFFIC